MLGREAAGGSREPASRSRAASPPPKGILRRNESRTLGGLRDFHPTPASGQKRRARFAPTPH